MNFQSVLICVIVGALMLSNVLCQDPPKQPHEYKVGEPQFSLQGAGGGQNARNWQAGLQGGLGTKVWESKRGDQSLEVGGTYGRGFMRHEGRTYKSEPNFGVGMTYRWGKK